MNETSSFTPTFLTAAEYVFALHEPSDHVAVLVRNRTQQQTMQRILPAETIASAPFQSWLREQNLSGADIFVGMNPRRIAKPDERTNPGDPSRIPGPRRGRRHFTSGDPHLRRRAAAQFCSRHFARKTSSRVARRGPRHEPGGNAVACIRFAVWRRPGRHRHLSASSFAWIHEQKIQRSVRRASAPRDRLGL